MQIGSVPLQQRRPTELYWQELILFLQVKMFVSTYPCETAPGVVHPVLGCSVPQKHGHAGVSPVEAQKHEQETNPQDAQEEAA